MNNPQRFATQIQNLALSLVFKAMGESRYNRTNDEYMAVSARLPPLKQLLPQVNGLLKEMHEVSARDGVPMPQICRFKKGDQRIVYEPYPREISYETLRAALTVSGMRLSRRNNHKSL